MLRSGPRTLSHSLVLIFSLVFVIGIGTLSYLQYSSTYHEVSGQFDQEINKTVFLLNHSVIILEEALEIYDSRYDYEMEKALNIFNQEYLFSYNDPSSLNLTQIRDMIDDPFSGTVDLFIINRDGIVQNSTYEPDIGLDFSEYPKFYSELEIIRTGNTFVPDQWVDSLTTPGLFRKYGYLPTPDHQYILEIGIDSDVFWKGRRDALSYQKLGTILMNINSDLKTITFFDTQLNAIDPNPGRDLKDSKVREFIPADILIDDLQRVFRDKNSFSREIGDLVINYQFIESSQKKYPSTYESSLVAVMVFSKERRNELLTGYLIVLIGITFIALLGSLVFSIYISRYIATPIVSMIHDIELISKGNYDHQISGTGGTELETLHTSINKMVKQILEDNEEIWQAKDEVSRELERRKQAEESLLIANTKLHNLASISRHDIMNQITCIRGYAFLAEQADTIQEAKEYIHEINRLSRLIEDIIGFSRDYHTIGVTGPIWQNLNDIIEKSTIHSFGSAISVNSQVNIELFADPLLQRVFFNLVDNSLKYGGEGGKEIFIRFEEKDDGNGVIIYEDHGMGIAEDLKEQIFDRGYGKGSGLGLFLIREILAITKITIKETGIYGKGARFEINIPKNQFRKTKN